MEFSGKLAREDLDDLAYLLGPRFYWLRLLLENWRGAALVGALIWATVLALTGESKIDWWPLALIWTAVVAISTRAAYKALRERREEIGELNAQLPNTVSFTGEGIECEGPDGARLFLPWRHFTGWRERRRVVVVDRSRGGPVMLSVAHLSELERQYMRDFLRSHIPPARS